MKQLFQKNASLRKIARVNDLSVQFSGNFFSHMLCLICKHFRCHIFVWNPIIYLADVSLLNIIPAAEIYIPKITFCFCHLYDHNKFSWEFVLFVYVFNSQKFLILHFKTEGIFYSMNNSAGWHSTIVQGSESSPDFILCRAGLRQ